jgi:hypothetical protein
MERDDEFSFGHAFAAMATWRFAFEKPVLPFLREKPSSPRRTRHLPWRAVPGRSTKEKPRNEYEFPPLCSFVPFVVEFFPPKTGEPKKAQIHRAICAALR